jgi:cysteinyl-tRNA synthetase
LIFFLKYLKANIHQVTYVRNITDVDDKIIKSSNEKKISISDLTQTVIKSFSEDCNYLNCEIPTAQPKATEHIDLMIEMVSELIKKGFAYENNKHVYFEVKKFEDYGNYQIKN